jgi:hypothetical protein
MGNREIAARRLARAVIATACAMPIFVASGHAAVGWGIITAADWVKNNPRATLPHPSAAVTKPAASISPPNLPPPVQSQEPPPLPAIDSSSDQPVGSTSVTSNSANLPFVVVDPAPVVSPDPSPDNGELLIEPPVAIDPILIQSNSLNVTPEPATLIVALTGLSMMWCRRTRRTKKL